MKKIGLSVLLIFALHQIGNAETSGKVADSAKVGNSKTEATLQEGGGEKTQDSNKSEKSQKAPNIADKQTQQDSSEALKKQAEDATKQVQDAAKIAKEGKKSHKGQIVGMQRGHTGLSFKPASGSDSRGIYIPEVAYEIGVGYFVTDRVRIEGLIGLNAQGVISVSEIGSTTSKTSKYSSSTSDTDSFGFGLSLPIELVASYSITNFANWDKDIEVFGSIGYDFKIYASGVKRFNLAVGLQLGRYMGLRFTYSPYANYSAPEVKVNGTTIKGEDPKSFYLLGLSLSYRI